MNRVTIRTAIAVGAIAMFACCGKAHVDTAWEIFRADRVVLGTSRYPIAIDPKQVGSYPANTGSGAGYFYDDVLEYRVWMHPERSATPRNGNSDYFYAFAQYERAESYSKKTKGAEEPLVLVRQREWIAEPKPHEFHVEHRERMTEWQVQWLDGHKRGPNSIKEFLLHPRPARPNE